MKWNASEDTLSYSIVDWADQPCTKRSILSWMAKIFDPLGLLSPVLIVGKMLIQRLWIAKLNWDDKIPEDIQTVWLRLIRDLPRLQLFSMSRFVALPPCGTVLAFCDASEKAYGCCVYLLVEKRLRLVFSKSRVAPVKVVSLARLELCAAVICTRAVAFVIECLNLNARNCMMFTDSKIVLSWLAKPAYCWKTFIANRVSEIQNTIPDCKWFHIGSAENPADIVSRGMFPTELVENSLWWCGPVNLDRILNAQPSAEFSTDLEATNRAFVGIATSVKKKDYDGNIVIAYLMKRISSLFAVIRIYAWIRRFVARVGPLKVKFDSGVLSVAEIEASNLEIVKFVQRCHFGDSIRRMLDGKPLKKSDALLALSPFVDRHSVLRVGGRLRNSALSFEQRHPILLPKKDRFTYALIRGEHIRLNHIGANGLLNSLRQRYWIVKSRNCIRSVLRKCFRCFRYQPNRETQFMGDLPYTRSEISRAFFRTGIDLCGPFFVRPTKKRGNSTTKCYVALFICMSTKAIHLESVFDLTSESFLAAFRRFCSRRGLPRTIFTDNGTNFVGASNTLREWYELLNASDFQASINQELLNDRIEWKFIPPRTPTFGGLWESHIKSFKSLFLKCAGGARLTYEEFHTLVAQVEASLNSRPLCAMNESTDDLDNLTPGHFLIGQPMKMLPCPSSHDFDGKLSKRWRFVQELYTEFWRRWSAEYLQSLQQRKINKIRRPNLQVGDFGLVVDDLLPPLQWRLGRIVRVVMGKDGLVRVVGIKTQKGLIERGIRGFCKFDFAEPQNGGDYVQADLGKGGFESESNGGEEKQI